MEDNRIKCLFCGDLFIPPRPWSKFCSTKCRNNHHNDQRLIEKGDASIPIIKCPHCKTDDQHMLEYLRDNCTGKIYLCNVCAKEFVWEVK